MLDGIGIGEAMVKDQLLLGVQKQPRQIVRDDILVVLDDSLALQLIQNMPKMIADILSVDALVQQQLRLGYQEEVSRGADHSGTGSGEQTPTFSV